MKTNIFLVSKRGFSKVDLLFVIATIVVTAALLLLWISVPRQGTKGNSCANNLKQIGIGFRLYALDGAPYPEYHQTNEVWQYFQVVGREIGSPKVLVCPEDTQKNNRAAALDFELPATLTTNNFAHPIRQNNSLSYFQSPDASEQKPYSILAGDRNVSTNKTTISGLLTVGTNTPIQWTKGPHQESGNILFADGSAMQVNSYRLREEFSLNTNITQRLLIP